MSPKFPVIDFDTSSFEKDKTLVVVFLFLNFLLSSLISSSVRIFKFIELSVIPSSLKIYERALLSFSSKESEIGKFVEYEINKLTYRPSFSSNFLYASITFLTRGCLITSLDKKFVKPIPSVS